MEKNISPFLLDTPELKKKGFCSVNIPAERAGCGCFWDELEILGNYPSLWKLRLTFPRQSSSLIEFRRGTTCSRISLRKRSISVFMPSDVRLEKVPAKFLPSPGLPKKRVTESESYQKMKRGCGGGGVVWGVWMRRRRRNTL